MALDKVLASLVVAVFLISVLIPSSAFTQTAALPQGELAIAYRQRQDGQLSQAVFQNYLRCFGGRCSLVTLTLNQCIAGKFYPKIQEWSTDEGWSGRLSIRRVASDTLVAEIHQEGARFQMRFSFHEVKHPYTGEPWFGGVKQFTGGVVKDSDLLGKVITWELVPLSALDATAVKFNCPALLDGVVPY